MSERPIIFSAPMIRALLDGRKTQTRRVLKPQPKPHATFFAYDFGNNGFFARWLEEDEQGHADLPFARIPAMKGDRLWVREAHYLTDDGDSGYAVFAEDANGVSDHLENIQTLMNTFPKVDWSKHARLRPSIHMPRWASRLTLIVTDVRVQRLQEISEADARAEGAKAGDWPDRPHCSCDDDDCAACSHYPALHIPAFKRLWDTMHGPAAWDANPWVAALTFTVHKRNIRQMEPTNDQR